jgi:hypothetical protein
MTYAASMPTSRCCCAEPSTTPGECRRGLDRCLSGDDLRLVDSGTRGATDPHSTDIEAEFTLGCSARQSCGTTTSKRIHRGGIGFSENIHRPALAATGCRWPPLQRPPHIHTNPIAS